MSPKVLRFSGSYLASSRLPRALQPTLNRLAAQTQESFSAVVLDGEEVVIVARSGSYAAPTRVLAYGLHLGARLPAHATSTGRVLLAALSPAQLTEWLKARRLSRLTPQTITQARGLRQRIAQARKDDFCFASEEHELGVQALAVPLRDMQGRTVAALNVVLSGGRYQEDALRRDLLPLLFDAAREVRALL
jgi:IclR family pca regulon transcriptional regulator